MSERILGLFKFPNMCESGSKRGFSKLTYTGSGRVIFGEGVPELNRPNVPQAKLCLTTRPNVP